MSSEGESLGQTNSITAYINTEMHSPIYPWQYPISHKKMAIIDVITKDMLNEHVIRE